MKIAGGFKTVKPLLAVMCLLVFAGACATYPGKVPVETRARMKNVTVVSLLGDEIYQKHIGTTVFTNKDTYHPVPGWNMDQFLASFVENELCRKQSLRCVDAKGGGLSLKDLYGSAENYDRHPFKIEEIQKELEQAANELGVDTFVLLVRNRGEDPFSGLPFHGYCLSRKSFLGLPASVRLDAAALMLVVDARAMNVSAARSIVMFEEVDRSLWKDDLEDLASSESKRLQELMKQHLTKTIRAQLEKLELI